VKVELEVSLAELLQEVDTSRRCPSGHCGHVGPFTACLWPALVGRLGSLTLRFTAITEGPLLVALGAFVLLRQQILPGRSVVQAGVLRHGQALDAGALGGRYCCRVPGQAFLEVCAECCQQSFALGEKSLSWQGDVANVAF